jgi:hypothetical protein
MVFEFPDERLPVVFVAHAADILGDTNSGLSGTQIVQACRGYAAEYGIIIPHAVYPWEARNKRTALFENLQEFKGTQQHRILRDLCDHHTFTQMSPQRQKLKIELATTYKKYDKFTGADVINETLVEETRHWLDGCPDALAVYNEAIAKYRADVFQRNVLDDLRLALELLLKHIFQNGKSLENQMPLVGQFLKDRGASPQLRNMFMKLIDYYCDYQNSYVKHADAVIEQEVEFVIEITSSLMKHVVRMQAEPT